MIFAISNRTLFRIKFMKSFHIVEFFIVAFVPLFTFAGCSPIGFTVIYVIGMLTSQSDALVQSQQLQDKLGYNEKGENLTVRLGYNPSHVAGGGDVLESVTQAFGAPVSDHDLKTILMQIAPEVTTRKILLLGHSQGAFYTDEMYQYLVANGVPKNSIAVYNVATPESFVAGGGGYLTSTNDKVINAVRDAENEGNLQIYLNSYYVDTRSAVSSALRANTTIPKEATWSSDPNAGHDFGGVYLTSAASRIVGDLNMELENLSAAGANSSGDCFAPPAQDLSFKTQSVILAAADSLVGGVADVSGIAANGVAAIAGGASGALASVGAAIQSGLSLLEFGSSSTSQAAAAALPVDAAERGQLALAPQTQTQTLILILLF